MYISPQPSRRRPWRPTYELHQRDVSPPDPEQTRDLTEKKPAPKYRDFEVWDSKESLKVYDTSRVFVNNGGYLYGCFIWGGLVTVKPGGVLRNCIINAGELVVEQGGLAEGITMKKDGRLDVHTGGTANYVYANDFVGIFPHPGANITFGFRKF